MPAANEAGVAAFEFSRVLTVARFARRPEADPVAGPERPGFDPAGDDAPVVPLLGELVHILHWHAEGLGLGGGLLLNPVDMAPTATGLGTTAVRRGGGGEVHPMEGRQGDKGLGL